MGCLQATCLPHLLDPRRFQGKEAKPPLLCGGFLRPRHLAPTT